MKSTAEPPIQRPTLLSTSMSNSELSKVSGGVDAGSLRKTITKWNPFEDPTPFSQMTEDHIFDAEFDAIRQRGSQTSMCIVNCFKRNLTEL